MRAKRNENGFTFVELLMALMVVSIVLAATATLAYTLGAVNETTNDMAEKQAQVRFASVRISELIRHCKLICGDTATSITIWKSDDNSDNVIDSSEQTYIEAVDGKLQLRDPGADPVVLIAQCSNVQFQFDEPSLLVMKRKFVSISFDIVEDIATRRYQINAALRGWAGNLLNTAGDAVASDDD
ncbi:MAG: type II secretion system protein [Phycisphaerae bacterium]|nr:type II secretion system protein [Phycisphaerae bacterium]MDD5381257.1 type II secretion system protein [Phycisphaerae bacterium]